jgi:CubicO group peptidase (beta-lactamase class C family)
MISDRLTRRSFLSRGACATVAMAASPIAAPPFTGIDMPAPVAANPLEHQLDAYIATYMIAMNAPGMTLALTDTGRTLRTAGYGFADADRKIAVSTDQLFQIGSITKSFVALVLLQLYEEGKLDLQKPVLEYLPWLPITTRFGPISPHHLLTHTSGLPDNMSLFPAILCPGMLRVFGQGSTFITAIWVLPSWDIW